MVKPPSSFSERMRSSAAGTWNAIVSHRFFREIQSDTIEDRQFARYLRLEYGFVRLRCCGARLCGGEGAVVSRETPFDPRPLWAGDQPRTIFQSAFERTGAPPEARIGLPPDRLSAPLHDLFLGTAKDEGYEEILACTMAAEWMYLTWCSKTNLSPSSRDYIRDWVALHAGGAFVEQVAWVRSEIDTRAHRLSAARQLRVCTLFEEVLAAEILFYDAVYS